MLHGLERFSVSAPGGIVNEYRIHGGSLELRTSSQEAKTAKKNGWRKLETGEIMLHLLLDTVVGQWLMTRRGFHKALESQGLPTLRQASRQAA